MNRAARLAGWTKLDADSFADAYVLCAVQNARKWETLEAVIPHGGDDAALIAAASNEAENFGFISELALTVTKMEARRGRAGEDIAALVQDIGLPGQMQALSNRAAGMLDPAIFEHLAAARDASAYVSENDGIIGTAFLVAPDLVLTSAHVALAIGKDGNGAPAFEEKLRPKLRFSFRPEKRDPAQQRIEVAASGNAPVACRLPHGFPPDQLDRALGPISARKLDYALVRLSRMITHVPWLDIKEPNAPQEHRKCFVIGYPGGGRAIKFDADLVTRLDRPGARLLHLANTIAGMSGSCCVGPEGTPVGLHEGGFNRVDANGPVVDPATGKPIFENNRAVCLLDIRDALRAMKPDPLLAKPRSSGFAILDASLRVTWYGAGLRLAGENLGKTWTRSVTDVLGAVPSGEDPGPAFHPWFKRKQLEDWIDAAAKIDAADRIAYINGDAGSGKSFAVQILAAKLDDPSNDLIALSQTQTTWPWAEAVAKLPRGSAGGGDPSLRTESGGVKFVEVAAIIAGLRHHGGADREASNRPLFVAIDFEGNAQSIVDATPWREFIKQLASEPWIRLAIIGLSEAERGTLDGILAHERATETLVPEQITLEHAGQNDMQQFIRGIFDDRGVKPKKTEIDDLLRLWQNDPSLQSLRPELQTCTAVLAALKIYGRVTSFDQPAVTPAAGGGQP